MKGFETSTSANAAVRLYIAGMSPSQLAVRYRCDREVILDALSASGCVIRSGNTLRKVLPISNDDLKKEYESGSTLAQLGKKYGCGASTISVRLKSIDCIIRAPTHQKKVLQITNDELIREYENGSSTHDLGKKYGYNPTIINRRLQSSGVAMRPHHRLKKDLPMTDNELVMEYESGSNAIQLAEKCGCTHPTILHHLKSMGCVIRKSAGRPEWTESQRIAWSAMQQGISIEDWDGFSIEQKYCHKFNQSCRESNRGRYGRKCFICGKGETENGRKLSVHHIDRNKDQGCNGHSWDLVPLCSSCHGKSHTPMWEARISYILEYVWR